MRGARVAVLLGPILLAACAPPGDPSAPAAFLFAVSPDSALAKATFECSGSDGCATHPSALRRGAVFASSSRHYDEGMELRPAFNLACSVRLVPIDAAPSEATLDPEGRLSFPEVRAGEDALWIARADGAEEWILQRERPAAISWRLELGPDAASAILVPGGSLELRDADGRACLRANAPYVIDGNGTRRDATFELDGLVLSLRYDATGLTRPFAVDPAWTTTGSLSIPRSDTSAILLPTGKVMFVGGSNGGGATVNSFELYDPDTGTFTVSAHTLNTPRKALSQVVLQTGKVLGVGGENGSTALATAETYDPSTDQWTLTSGSMSVARYGENAVLLNDGTVMIAGGGTSTNVVERFNPATGTFANTPGVLSVARLGTAAAKLSDGRVLIVGGQDSGSTLSSVADIFNPATGAIAATAPLTTGARQFCGLTLLTDGKALAYGGLGISGLPTAVKTAEYWDPSTSTWTAAGNMSTSQYGFGGALLPDGRVFTAGGLTGTLTGTPTNTTNLYSGGTMWTAGPTMSTAHNAHGVAMLPSGRVLMGGGQNSGSTYTSVAEVFDPSSPAWSTVSMPASREYPAASALVGGDVLIAGGNGSAGTPLASAVVFSSATATFSATSGPMASARVYATATLLLNGKVLIAGGAGTGGGALNTSELYDPSTGTFGGTATMTQKRSRHTATLLPDGKVLVAGGCDGTTCPSGAEIYDPATNSWTATAGNMVQPRYVHMATLLKNGKVLIFGGSQPSISTYYRAAELFDPSTGLFTATGQLVSANGRELATSVLLGDGRVLAAGGYDGTQLATAELYSPSSGTWTATSGSLATARSAPNALLLDDGRVLIVAGQNGVPGATTAEYFDPTRGVFAPAGTTTSRFRSVVAPLPDGRVLLAGGTDGTTGRNDAQLFDPGFAPLAVSRPQPVFQPVWLPGNTYSVTGTKLRGVSDASGGNFQLASAADHPLLVLQRLDNGDTRILPTRSATGASITFDLPAGFPLGSVRARVVSAGNPSTASIVHIGTVPSQPPTHVAFSGGPASVAAGQCAGPFTVELRDATNAPTTSATAYSIALTTSQGASGAFYSDSGCGTPQATYPINAGSTSTAGFYYRQTLATGATLTATTTGLSNGTRAITVTAAAASVFAVTGFASSVTAGASAPLTVTAKDPFGNTDTQYAGTVTFTSNDPQAVLPPALVFTGAENGVATSANATLKTAGTRTFTATAGAVTGTHANITVSAAAATTFIVTGFGASVVAGASAPLTVTAKDPFGNTDLGYAGTVTFTSSDPQAGLPAPLVFNGTQGGVGTSATATLKTAGTRTFTATAGSVSGTHANITVTAAAATTFVVTGFAASVVAGASAPLTVTAKDPFGNTDSAYAGTVTFTSNDPLAGLPAPLVFNGTQGGVGTSAPASLKTAGTRTFTATAGSVSGTHANITVTAAAASSFLVTGFASSVVAGTSAPLTVTAKDAFGNTDTAYAGTVTFTSSDPQAVLPAPLVFNGTQGGVGTSASATLKTVGSRSFTATAGSVTGTHANITVTAAAATAFVVTGFAASVVAGASAPLTVTAKDPFGNTDLGYAGTVSFTSSDPQAGLPAPLVFNGTQNGAATSAPATLKTAGTRTFTATAGSLSGTHANITVTAAAATTFVVTGFAASVVAGTSAPLTVTAKDPYGNTDSAYAGTVTFTSSDPQAVLPAPLVFNGTQNGTATSAPATLKTAGTRTFTATAGSLSGTHANITVTAAAATTFIVSGFAASVVAGTSAPLTVTAQDPFGNRDPAYAGTVSFTSTDPQAVLPAPLVFNGTQNGIATSAPATLKTAGTRTFTATAGSVSGTHANITVTAAAATTFIVTGFAASVVAGASAPLTVTAMDPFGNTDSAYAGTVTFTSNDPLAGLPAPLVFNGTQNGTGTSAPASLKTAGTRTFTATAGSVSGTHANITVTAAAATSFVVTGFAPSVVAGTSAPLTVAAKDAFGNTDTAFAGTVTFTSSDPQAVLPAPLVFNGTQSGVGTSAPATLKTVGSRSFTATSGSVTGTHANITVTAAAATAFVVTGFAASVVAGSSAALTVTAKDAFGNTDTAFTGTVTITSDDPQAVLPAPLVFGSSSNGVATSTPATVKTAGVRTFTATFSGTATITGTHPNITVTAGAASSLSVTGFAASVPAGSSSALTVTALDSFGNADPSFAGTVTFSSNDPQAVLPAALVFNGTQGGTAMSTPATVKTAGIRTFTASGGGLTGTHANITVTSAPASSFLVSGFPATVTAGATAALTVTAQDTFGNTDSAFTGTVTFTSSDPQATLPPPLVFTGAENGTASSGNATVKTSGTQTFTATSGGVSGTHPNILVTAGPATAFTVTGFAATVPAGTSAPLTVTARDGFGNVDGTFAGTVVFTSTDAAAKLPPALVFTGAEGGSATSSPATLRSGGDHTFTATSGMVSGTHANIHVTAGPAAALSISGFPSPTTAGASQSFMVDARDTFGNHAASYAGTVAFTSDDPKAQLPAAYTFTPADGGHHVFSGALFTAGVRTLTASDGTLSNSQVGIQVNPGPTTTLVVSGIPSPIDVGVAADVQVEARDAAGNRTPAYTGTVRLSSTDNAAQLAPQLPFSPAIDQGAHVFSGGVRFFTAGMQAVTAQDVGAPSIQGTQSGIEVVANGPPVILRDANLKAAVGVPYQYDALGAVTASGLGPISFDACGGPVGFTVDPSSGAVSWTPAAAGSVPVCVKAVNAAGEDTYSFTVDVIARAATPVVAHAVATPALGAAPLLVTLDASGSTADPSALPLMFDWSFGDGSPPAAGVTPQHTYVLPGGYVARVTAFDAYGGSDQATAAIQATGPNGEVPPIARIVASATHGEGSLSVDFSCDCAVGSAPIVGYRWELGDGTSAFDAATTHAFEPGRWQVTLTVVDGNGLSASDSVDIVVTKDGKEPPRCEAGVSPAVAAAPVKATWRAIAGPGVVAERWSFGESSATNDVVQGAIVQRSYDVAGRFPGAFSADDANGLSCHSHATLVVLDAQGRVPPDVFASSAAPRCAEKFEWTPVATGSGPFTWSAEGLPEGATLDPTTGAIAWRPTKDDAGVHEVTVRATGPAGTGEARVRFEVACDARRTLAVGCGCGAAQDDGFAEVFAVGAFALVAFGARRRRRSRAVA